MVIEMCSNPLRPYNIMLVVWVATFTFLEKCHRGNSCMEILKSQNFMDWLNLVINSDFGDNDSWKLVIVL